VGKNRSSDIESKLASALDRLESFWMVLGFLYLAIYSFQVVAQPSEAVFSVLEAVNWGIYGVFAVELVLRIVSERASLTSLQGALDFAKMYWLSVIAVMLPAFRSLRVLRVLVVLRAFEPFLWRRTHKLSIVTLVTVPLLMYTSAVSVLEAEQNVDGASITSFGDAVWWSLATVTTVGYGDMYPITHEGRLVATFLMILGISLFGALTALLAAWVLGEDKLAKQKKS